MEKLSKKEIMLERMGKKREEVKTVRKIVFFSTLAILIIVLIIGFSGYNYVKKALQPVDPDSEKVIEVSIPIGSGVSTIAAELEKKKIIKSARVFKYYAKFNNESQFQAGTYGLSQSMTPDELIQSLKTGKVYRTPVFTMTVPEGLTVEQIAAIVEKKAGIPAQKFMDYISDENTITNLMNKYPQILTDEIKNEQIRHPLEGYLFPATYPFYEENPTVATIVDTMLQATAMNVRPYYNYLEEQEKSVHWLLTFASLLEKEATAQSDRQTIASVFNNRIDEGMPLQTDPTVLYALGEHKDRVLYKDLEVDNAYNTYKNTGLPPGPIASAGVASIEAVIDPSQTDYLFFLADKTGTNHFTKSYDEHLKNKELYLSGD